MADPWYADGLRFTCTQCGNCCGGAPGFVYISTAEIDVLAARLGLDRAAFARRYIREVWRSGMACFSLVEKKNHDCVFFVRGKGCSVYADRPQQCRTWPFWRPLIADRDSWDSHAVNCPGMDHGELHPAEEISRTAAADGLP
jgi:Fe-S-cluster containining protein